MWGCIPMKLDYSEIGKRIAACRKRQGLKQNEVEERAGISFNYLSKIENGVSIPSTEVIMRLTLALNTTPDEFLVGTVRWENEEWRTVAEGLRGMDEKQLAMAKKFIEWLREQEL